MSVSKEKIQLAVVFNISFTFKLQAQKVKHL